MRGGPALRAPFLVATRTCAQNEKKPKTQKNYFYHKGVPRGAHVLAPGAALAKAYLLGLLAKIKCSICSYQLNLWYVAHGVTSD